MTRENIKLFEKKTLSSYLEEEIKKIKDSFIKEYRSQTMTQDNFEGQISMKTTDMKIKFNPESVTLNDSYEEIIEEKPIHIRIFTLPIQGNKELLFYRALPTRNLKYDDLFYFDNTNLYFNLKIEETQLTPENENKIIEEYKEMLQYLTSHLEEINNQCQNAIEQLKSSFSDIKKKIEFDNQLLDKIKKLNN